MSEQVCVHACVCACMCSSLSLLCPILEVRERAMCVGWGCMCLILGSFLYCASKQQNSLCSEIRHIQSSHAFKTALKTHLYKQYHNSTIYEPVTKGRDLKWDTLPQNQTPSKLFSVLPLESSMFQVTISIIKKWF